MMMNIKYYLYIDGQGCEITHLINVRLQSRSQATLQGSRRNGYRY